MAKCLILAAGKGTRLSKRGVSKPLIYPCCNRSRDECRKYQEGGCFLF